MTEYDVTHPGFTRLVYQVRDPRPLPNLALLKIKPKHPRTKRSAWVCEGALPENEGED